MSLSSGSIVMWAEDFLLSLKDRPIFFRLLFRIVVGEVCYREFLGLVESVNMYTGGFIHNPDITYLCDNLEYHKDYKTWIWWKKGQ